MFACVEHNGNRLGRVCAERGADSPVRRLEPLDNLASEWFVGGLFEQRREVRRACFVEAALKLVFLAPVSEPLLKLAPSRVALPCGFVDRDRVVQTARPVVQFPEPHRRWQITRVERKGALEAGLRHVVPPEHESGDARTEAKACVAGPHRRCLGERLQRLTETPILDGGGALAGQGDRISRCAWLSGGHGDREHQQSGRDQKWDLQGNALVCKKGTREMPGNSLAFRPDREVVRQRVHKRRRHGSSRNVKAGWWTFKPNRPGVPTFLARSPVSPIRAAP